MTNMAVVGGKKLDAYLGGIVSKSAGRTLRVGFLPGSIYPDGKAVATVAAINEYGAPSRGIPPRPFFRTTIDEKSSGWGDLLKGLLVRENYDSTLSLSSLGEVIVDQIKSTIINGDWEPNAPSTVRRKGFQAPLIDTTYMINSLGHEVVKR